MNESVTVEREGDLALVTWAMGDHVEVALAVRRESGLVGEVWFLDEEFSDPGCLPHGDACFLRREDMILTRTMDSWVLAHEEGHRMRGACEGCADAWAAHKTGQTKRQSDHTCRRSNG